MSTAYNTLLGLGGRPAVLSLVKYFFWLRIVGESTNKQEKITNVFWIRVLERQ